MPSHFIGMLFLGPRMLLYIFRGSTPWNHTGLIIYIYTYIHVYTHILYYDILLIYIYIYYDILL